MAAQEEALSKATKAYAQHQKDWAFLGYNETIALAVLTEFFSMGKVRNPSWKPLNVLSMVGKSRIKAIKEAVTETKESDTAPDNAEPDANVLKSE